MKRLQDLADRSRPVATLSALLAAAALASAFWFATSPRASATDCTLCHKRVLTITVVCGSMDYQRHIDHGDTIGPCAASQ